MLKSVIVINEGFFCAGESAVKIACEGESMSVEIA